MSEAESPVYARVGNGQKPLVMLPGLSFQGTLGLADLVAAAYGPVFRDYTIYLFDDRTRIEEGYSIRKRAGDVAEKLAELKLGPACVYGVSMGGMVAQWLAIDHPELVGKLALTATTAAPCERAVKVLENWKALVLEGKIREAVHQSTLDIYSAATVAQYGAVLEGFADQVSEKEQRDFVRLVDAILGFSTVEELHKIACPIWIAGSEGDRVLFPEGARLLSEKLNCEPFLYGSQYGHAVYDEAPEHKQRLLDFFEAEACGSTENPL